MTERRVLVVEGGGLRGAFCAGAVAELERLGTPRFSDVVGVSSGAPTAAYYATGQAEDALTIWRDHVHGAQLIDPRNVLRRQPILNLAHLERVFEAKVPLDRAALDTSATRVWVGTTECHTGAPRYVQATSRNALALLRATMALPIAYGRTVDVDGVTCIDGGITAPVALAHARSLAPSRLVLVLTRPPGHRRAPSGLVDRLIGWTYPRHRAVRAAMLLHASRANEIAAQIEALEASGQLTVIRPTEVLPATRLSRDAAAIRATIARGVEAARRWAAATPS